MKRFGGRMCFKFGQFLPLIWTRVMANTGAMRDLDKNQTNAKAKLKPDEDENQQIKTKLKSGE